MKPQLLILFCVIFACFHSTLCVRMQNLAMTSSQTTFENTLTKTTDNAADWNGNIFEADTSFEIIDQPLSVLDSVNGLGKVESQSLDKQNDAMIEYLQEGDDHLIEIVDNSTVEAQTTQTTESNSQANASNQQLLQTSETTKAASAEVKVSASNLELPIQENRPETFLGKETEKEGFNLKGAATLAQATEDKPAANNLLEISSENIAPLTNLNLEASSNLNSEPQSTLSLSTLDLQNLENGLNTTVLAQQSYEIEEVYWKNRHTRVKVVRPVLRDLSDPISILFFMVLAFLMIGTIILVRETINRWMQKNFGASLDAILKDIITLYLIITILRILDYFDIFLDLEYYVNMRLVSVSFLIFSIFWLILGVYSVLRCHGFVKGWNDLEKDFPKRDQIFRQYENLYLEPSRTKGQSKEMEGKRQQLEYFLIRQEFVFPTFLPVLGEAFLRDDFNFATYMAKSLARASDSMFKYSFISLLTIIIIGALWLFFAGLSVRTQVFVLGALPVVIFLMFLAMNLKLKNIYRKLVQIVDSPYDVNFTKFDNLRQPLINLDKLKVPDYLSENNPPPSGSRIFSTFRMPNRHERLFWLASPRFMVRLMHIILILQIIWITVLALAFGGNLEDYRQIILVAVGALLTLINILYFVPANLKIFCLTNSIQMLKDRKIIAEVIDDNKRRNAELFMKLFRLLKSRSREQRFGEARPVSLREVIIDQVRTYFQSLPKEDNDKISIVYLKDLAHYCGADLSDEEIVYLSRASKDNENKVAFPNLMEAIEKFVDDVRQDKFRMIRDTLKSIIKRDDGMVSLRELRDAITESQILPQEEIDAMMHEIRYLPFRNAEISIDLVARFIRDSIEGMPV